LQFWEVHTQDGVEAAAPRTADEKLAEDVELCEGMKQTVAATGMPAATVLASTMVCLFLLNGFARGRGG
jgi:hypothetical protein